jgi:hypothetical protein
LNATVVTSPDRVEWALLAYRVPRDPSTPRIAIWRKLKRLGVAQVGDGLVALPADARTQEQLDWVAQDVVEAGGTSTLWRARLTSRAQEQMLVTSMRTARAVEYDALVTKVPDLPALGDLAPNGNASLRVLRSLRRELREIQRRDFFPPPERERARAAIEEFAATATAAGDLVEVQA